jgi:DNA-binding CsgD family transcriptional regulator
MPNNPRRPLALVVDSDGHVQRASPSAVTALGPDGKPPVDVRVKGKIWRMFCAGTGDERVVLLQPTGEEVEGASTLSPREREVLGLVALGFTNARIARRLALSHATVRTHMEHILAKLNVRTRTAAVAKAMQAGLIEK